MADLYLRAFFLPRKYIRFYFRCLQITLQLLGFWVFKLPSVFFYTETYNNGT
ncbi:hypothetical protein BY458DRAFT_499801, partial [Sporodiniella umbellata]